MSEDLAIFRPAEDVSWQPMGPGQPTVALRLSDGQLYTLNETAGAFLAAADGRRTFAEILQELRREFDVSPEQLQKDMAKLLSEMLAEKLLVRV